MMAKHIAIVTSVHPDFDKRVWRHASSLAAAGCRVSLVGPWAVESLSQRDGVTFYPFRRTGSVWGRLFVVPFRVFGRLRLILKDVDVVHFHDIDLLPWMAALSIRKPVVYDVHENYPDEIMVRGWVPRLLRKPLAFIVRHVQRGFSRLVRNIVLVSPYQEKDFQFRGVNSIYVKNYASQRLVESVNPDYSSRENAVIFIGSQHANNGSLVFLEIAKKTLERGCSMKFYASDRFGSAVFKERYMQLRADLGLDDAVVLIPNVLPHRIMDNLNRATIAINPNLRVDQQIKGIHTKLFEFMAAALPVVTSDLPHQVEVIEDTGAGFTAKPEDPDSFVDHLVYLAQHRDLAQKIGKKGQDAFLDRYSWESQIPQLIGFYDEIVRV
jgi:glycosyltransferase involved in cell wall biosynthesis